MADEGIVMEGCRIDTVGRLLRDSATRTATLDALEVGHIMAALALAAAPALAELLSLDAAEVERATFDRVGLLLARLMAEAADDPAARWGAAWGGGRFAAMIRCDCNVVAKAIDRTPEGELTRDDAQSLACLYANYAPAAVRGWDKPVVAAGMSACQEMWGLWMKEDVLCRLRGGERVRQIATHWIELLRSDELPDLGKSGVWFALLMLISSFRYHPEARLGPLLVEQGLCDLAMAGLRSIGSVADWVTISRGKAGQAGKILIVMNNYAKCFQGQSEQPDIMAVVDSGVFEACCEAISIVAARGTAGLSDTDHGVLLMSLAILRNCHKHPECVKRIRSLASDLSFCLATDLEWMGSMCATTGSYAAQVCCGVFGKDEDSQFVFTQDHVDGLLLRWTSLFQGEAGQYYKMAQKPNPSSIQCLELCVSDKNKPLLLANNSFIPYLVDALLVDPAGPHADLQADLKSWCQTTHAECLAQMAVYPKGKEALRREPSVSNALQMVAEAGLTDEGRRHAQSALLALSDKELQVQTEGQKHVMLSCASPDQWDVQATIKRLNESLIARGYVTWFDLTNMKGSTVDAMSDAIEGADVMVYAVSLAYKESANCRLEANYAHQQELDMLPVMVQQNFKPKGWLGLILGTRLWYAFWDAEQDSDDAFERRLDPVVREIGERGQRMHTTTISSMVQQPEEWSAGELIPAPAPAPAPAQAPAAAASVTSTHRAPRPVTTTQQAVHSSRSSFNPSLQPAMHAGLHASDESGSRRLSFGADASSSSSQHNLSELLYLERADRADRAERERLDRLDRAERAERAAERERQRQQQAAAAADRTTLAVAFSVGTCACCSLGAAIVGAVALQQRHR